MANKKLTIGEVEKLKASMHTTIAEAVQSFESETGMTVDYISLTRKRDKMGTDMPVEPFSEDRGPVVDVNANTSMEF
jgi:hypothetical protein